MLAQQVVMPSSVESATLVLEGVVVEPVERILSHLTSIERSPNTVKAYAHDLQDSFVYLGSRDLQWSSVRRFLAWLRLPAEARTGRVALLLWVEGSLSARTVNQRLWALTSFYEFHQRHGIDVGELLTRRRPGGRGGSWQPFLAHLGSRPERHRTIALRAERRALAAR